MKNVKFVVCAVGRFIEAADRGHAEYLYGMYDRASIERWDVRKGTGKTIKMK